LDNDYQDRFRIDWDAYYHISNKVDSDEVNNGEDLHPGNVEIYLYAEKHEENEEYVRNHFDRLDINCYLILLNIEEDKQDHVRILDQQKMDGIYRNGVVQEDVDWKDVGLKIYVYFLYLYDENFHDYIGQNNDVDLEMNYHSEIDGQEMYLY